jgi:predicted RNA-binding Zn ribbon-like protein
MRDFEYKAGTLALNFVDTVAARTADATELLSTAEKLVEWAAGAGYELGPAESVAEPVLERVHSLREAVWRAFSAVLDGRDPAGADVEAVNVAARQAAFCPQLERDRVVWRAERPLEALLSAVATDAILRLEPASRARLRRCPGCQMIFFDTSPPARRVWCSSVAGCGNRFKKKRHYARQTKDNRKSHGDTA